ncbi:hypothetical protein [Amycolatopsis viridis]|uniref:Uncharacterized protein n=1 Tax=Amycolatopsis viridis TaxID=185678 RepID=A0ABX0T0G5_9PSEU|nr:hypothetical protein [Amycolatopsis viridis]NIH82718.1 hypothetical protein [Amycolatopsis viridis]
MPWRQVAGLSWAELARGVTARLRAVPGGALDRRVLPSGRPAADLTLGLGVAEEVLELLELLELAKLFRIQLRLSGIHR